MGGKDHDKSSGQYPAGGLCVFADRGAGGRAAFLPAGACALLQLGAHRVRRSVFVLRAVRAGARVFPVAGCGAGGKAEHVPDPARSVSVCGRFPARDAARALRCTHLSAGAAGPHGAAGRVQHSDAAAVWYVPALCLRAGCWQGRARVARVLRNMWIIFVL